MIKDLLKEKYKDVPEELKKLKRWVCWDTKQGEKGITKVPINAITGKFARSNDAITWTNFDIAINGCAKYNCKGLGFMLGDGIFGVDLDNHEDGMDEKEFDDFSYEFISELNSYTERSQSGKGIHIICYGTLPVGRRRKGNVEMYDSNRFFAFTGDVVNNVPIMNREEEIKKLYNKYLLENEINENNKNTFQKNTNDVYKFSSYNSDYKEEKKLNDSELIQKILSSASRDVFTRYFYGGDISLNANDHSSADMSFCSLLAFWTNKDPFQMDSIFRQSGLMREKWDRKLGNSTYGETTIKNAIDLCKETYINLVDKPFTSRYNLSNDDTCFSNDNEEKKELILDSEFYCNLDEYGEPKFNFEYKRTSFPFTDTGNAYKFWEFFHDLFRYNCTDNIFMYWNGYCWIRDEKKIIRKYANKLIEICEKDEDYLADAIKQAKINENKNQEEYNKRLLEASKKNTNRISNKAGKDALISEFQTLKGIPLTSDELNKDNWLLNTLSGVINLKNGQILPYDNQMLISQCVNSKVSFEEPTVWINFLNSIFQRENPQETKEIVDFMQLCLGYSLTGSTQEQVMFVCYGNGSNGKSTFSEMVGEIMDTYGNSTPSSTLMQQKNNAQNTSYSIAKLKDARYVETGETDQNGKLDEKTVKLLTGGDTISARFLYGNEFDFKPKFKIWMSTNHKPQIVGTDFGIWRRIIQFPFLRTFTGGEKDRDLPNKLRKEKDKILGWMIQGCLKYQEKNGLEMPQCLVNEMNQYKEQMDIVTQFIKKQCTLIPNYKTNCNTLYKNYKIWASDNTEYILKESKFSEELVSKGFKIIKEFGESFYVGIKLNCDKTTAYVFNEGGNSFD